MTWIFYVVVSSLGLILLIHSVLLFSVSRKVSQLEHKIGQIFRKQPPTNAKPPYRKSPHERSEGMSSNRNR